MKRMLSQLLRTGAVCGMLMVMNPFTSLAAIGPGFTAGTYVATITSESVNINKSQDSEEVLMTAQVGNTYEVLEDLGNGWMKIRVNDTEGYLPVSGNATVEEVAADEMAEVQQDALESSNSYKRQQVVNYAMQFVGGRYRYGELRRHQHEPLFRWTSPAGCGHWSRPDAAGRSAVLRQHKGYQSRGHVYWKRTDCTCFHGAHGYYHI